MEDRTHLLLHGWQGSDPGHWQPWLQRRLLGLGHDARMPALPGSDHPELPVWLAALDDALDRLPAEGERVVLCHSLGCALWLHHVARDVPPARVVDRVLLVAPPDEPAAVEYPQLRGFFPLPLDRPALDRAARGGTRLVCSPDDPYCRTGAPATVGDPLGLPTDVIAGGGHLNTEAGYGPWPQVEAWALGLRADVTGRE